MISFLLFSNNTTQKNISKVIENVKLFSKFNEEFELIIIVSPEQIKTIKNLLKENICDLINLKIIYSAKTLSMNKQIKFASNIAQNDYICLMDSTIKYKPSLINKLIKVINNESIDLIEIMPEITGSLNWKPISRFTNLKPLTTINVLENKRVIAQSFPFIQNKVFNKKVVLSVMNEKKYNDSIDFSTILSIDFLYKYLSKIKTFVWISSEIISINIQNEMIPHYKFALKEWKLLKQYYFENAQSLLSEINYAEIYYLLLILPSLFSVKNIKNIFNDEKIYKKKYFDVISKELNERIKIFSNENQYMLSLNNENQLLKEIPQINKWNKLLVKI